METRRTAPWPSRRVRLLAPIGFCGGCWLRSRPWAKEQFKRDAERRGHPTYGIMDTMVEVVEVRCCMELNIGGIIKNMNK